MKSQQIAKLTVLTTLITIATTVNVPVLAENLNDLNQLLRTKQCPQCDLSNAGLVQADLTGASFVEANLAGANLSQANLQGADLTGANLVGTSLHGANLTGANLTGANLAGTDLRNAYMGDANLTEVDLDSAHLEGIRGLSETAASAEQFHRWGVKESQLGNYNQALAHYQKAIKLDPELAPAYLGLAIIQYNFDHRAKAKANTEKAAELFKQQEHELGHQTAMNFQEQMTLIQEAEIDAAKKASGMGQVGKFMGGVGSLLLQFLL
ncbi:MAG: pentapeptide repeat-containing protein [Cyanobacteria bacterium P01_G01_bin.39]